jgi:nucleoside-diphosphate-sugar epimerase
MTSENQIAPVLVAGGTRRTGARLVRRLRDRRVAVRIGSGRAPTPFDWHDSTTWPPAVEGVWAAPVTGGIR